jgi:pimeloyl-ACP methyl ester carboxylesterase
VAGKDRGKLLFYTDQTHGRGGDPQTLLFVHGNPECSYLFSRTIRSLLELNLPLTRCISLDHIGFGLSSQATRPMDPSDHAANLALLLAALAPRRVTLVAHDWGGPIGLGALLEQPELLRNLVVLNSGIFPLAKRFTYRNYPFPLLSWTTLSSLVPDRHWGRFAAAAIANRAGSRGDLLQRLLRYPFKRHAGVAGDNPYAAQFNARANVVSSRHLARLSGAWCEISDTHHADLNDFYRRLHGDVGKCWGKAKTTIQARLLGGEWDPLGDQENARTWLQALPQLADNMVFYPGCGHFLPETHPAEIARTIYGLLALPGRPG